MRNNCSNRHYQENSASSERDRVIGRDDERALYNTEGMSIGINYSKWNKIIDSSDEEDEGAGVVNKGKDKVRQEDSAKQMEQAWKEIDKLQQIADGIFFKAERSTNLQEYQSAQKHYDEVLRLVKNTLELQQPGSMEKALKHIVSCNLNTACCYIRAKEWSSAEKNCTSALKMKAKMSSIEELRARYLRLYVNVQVLITVSDTQEQYQSAGMILGEVEEKLRVVLLEDVNADCSRLRELPIENPSLLDEPYVKSVLDAEDLMTKAKELSQRCEKNSNSSINAAPVNPKCATALAEAACVQQEREKYKYYGGSSASAGASEIDITSVVPAATVIEAKAEAKVSYLSSSTAATATAATTATTTATATNKKIEKNSDSNSDRNSKSSEPMSTPMSMPVPIVEQAESSIATMALQQAAKRYRNKEYDKALSQYMIALECLKAAKEGIAVKSASSPAPAPEGGSGVEEDETKTNDLLIAIAQSGKGSCLAALHSYDEALLELHRALRVLTTHVAAGLQMESRTISSPEAADAATPQHQEQIVTVARHMWNTIDNIVECLVKQRDWIAALERCEQGITLCKGLLDFAQGLQLIHKKNSTAMPISVQNSATYAINRRTTLLLSKGHILKEMHENIDTLEGAGAEAALAYAKSKERKTVDILDAIEDIVSSWDVAALGFSQTQNFVKASDTYGLIASLLAEFAGRLDKMGTLQPYMDWNEKPRQVDQDLAERAYVYFEKQGKEAGRAMEVEKQRRGKFNKNGSLRTITSTNTSAARTASTSTDVIEIEEDSDATDVSVFSETRKVPVSIPVESWELQREHYALYRILQSYFMAGVAALHVSAATDAVRSLEAALESHRSFVMSTSMEKVIDTASQEWRDFHCMLGDCAYHAALAYFRKGNLDSTLELLVKAVSAANISTDNTRKQHALGLRGLTMTMMGRKELADTSISEAGASALAPLESAESVMKQIKDYITQHAPRQLTDVTANKTPKMLKLDPADAARGVARKKKEEARLKNAKHNAVEPQMGQVRIERNPDAWEQVPVPKSMWGNVKEFLSGDGLTNVATAWILILLFLVSMYVAYQRVKEVAAQVNINLNKMKKEL